MTNVTEAADFSFSEFRNDSRPPLPSERLWLGATALATACFGLLIQLLTAATGLWFWWIHLPRVPGNFGPRSGTEASLGTFLIMVAGCLALVPGFVGSVFGVWGVFSARERGKRLSTYALVLVGVEVLLFAALAILLVLAG